MYRNFTWRILMKKLFLPLLIVLLSIESLFAVGAMYARRPLVKEDYHPIWLKSYDVDVTVTDQMAVTHVDHVFKNETNRELEGIFIFPLPENAIVTDLVLWEGGVPWHGTVMQSDTAESKFENIVKKSIDPALLEYMGNNLFKLRVYPISPVGTLDSKGFKLDERRVEITYAELLPYDDGNISYNFRMKAVDMSSKAVERTSLKMEMETQKEILSFDSPSHKNEGIVITPKSGTSYSVTYGEEETLSEKDMQINYTLKSDSYAVNSLTYTPNVDTMFFDTTGDHSYFLLWITPPDDITKTKILKKNMVFVADISSSMAGERIAQLKTSLTQMVSKLNEGDLFNIVLFSTGAEKFQEQMVEATPANIQSALAYIDRIAEYGLTNMEDAFKDALSCSWDDSSVNALVFLTDGMPTWPVNTTVENVLDTITAYNNKKVSIFSFGIGEEVDQDFMKRIANNNYGFETIITSDEMIAGTMERFMEKISYPVIKDITIDYGALNSYDIYPKTIPNLYAGSQVTVMGRYKTEGAYNITFNGKVGSTPFTLSNQLAFPSPANNQPFVARMWASAKIDQLLDDIIEMGELDELVDAVVALGVKYSIVTPYTSFLVIPDEGTSLLDKTISVGDKLSLVAHASSNTCQFRLHIPELQSTETAQLLIYDTRGRLVKSLFNEMTRGGVYHVTMGEHDLLASGLYIAVLKVGNMSQITRFSL